MELALGNFLVLSENGNVRQRFQNFFINQTIDYEGGQYGFLPFGFSGVTINRTGDNTEADLVFPNNALSRNWAVEALKKRWLAQVDVVLLNPDNTSSFDRVHRYVSMISGGAWHDAELSLTLNTVLDAVGADAPQRRLTQRLIGNIPATSNVRMQ